jgi:hypothetical protein
VWSFVCDYDARFASQEAPYRLPEPPEPQDPGSGSGSGSGSWDGEGPAAPDWLQRRGAIGGFAPLLPKGAE